MNLQTIIFLIGKSLYRQIHDLFGFGLFTRTKYVYVSVILKMLSILRLGQRMMSLDERSHINRCKDITGSVKAVSPLRGQ